MARDYTLQTRRDEAIRKRFTLLCKQRPCWRIEAVLQQLATEFYLSQRTIYAVLNKTIQSPTQLGKTTQQDAFQGNQLRLPLNS